MIGLIVYGSLLHKDEISKYKSKVKQVIKIKVLNHKRCFNLLPSVRIGIGNYKSVLNIKKSKNSYFNAVCIIYEKVDIKKIDEREKGYNRIKISNDNIASYHKENIPSKIDIYTYVGLKNKENYSIMPNVDYLKLCLEASKTWGEDFHDDFIKTTHINNNIKMERFIESNFTL